MIPWIDVDYVHIHSVPELTRSGHLKTSDSAAVCEGSLSAAAARARPPSIGTLLCQDAAGRAVVGLAVTGPGSD